MIEAGGGWHTGRGLTRFPDLWGGGFSRRKGEGKGCGLGSSLPVLPGWGHSQTDPVCALTPSKPTRPPSLSPHLQSAISAPWVHWLRAGCRDKKARGQRHARLAPLLPPYPYHTPNSTQASCLPQATSSRKLCLITPAVSAHRLLVPCSYGVQTIPVFTLF